MKKVTLTLLLILLILSNQGMAQIVPSIVADPVVNNGPVYYGHERNVARTSDGNILMVAWQDLASGGEVVYSIYDNIFQIWSPVLPISSVGDEADKIGLVADNQGRIHATWQQRESSRDKYQTYYAKYESGSFSTPVKVSQNDAQHSEECAIEIDSDGRIFVVWNTDEESNGDEWILCSVSSDNGVSWSIPDTLSSPNGIIDGNSVTSGRVTLYPGSGGRMLATWHEDVPERLDLEREIYVNQYDGSSWQGEVIISDTSADANVDRHWYPNGVLDNRDNIYVLYSTDLGGSDNPRYLILAKKSWDMAKWPTEREIVAESPSRDYLKPGITVDQNGILYVAYRRDVEADTLYDLDEIAYVASNDGGHTWTSPVILSRPNHDAGYPTLAARVFGDGIDVVWRESSSENVNDEGNTTILYVQMDLLSVVDRAPEVRGIPDQSIGTGEAFTPFDLDNYLIEFDGDAVDWSYSGNNELTVSIDGDHVVTVTTPSGSWTGSENITFTATDQTAGSLADSDDAIFAVGMGAVDHAPEVADIPDQTITAGESFTQFDLDTYLTELDGDIIAWSYSNNSELTVSIDGDNVVTITTPSEDWTGSETITFIATDQTSGSLSGSDNATFTVNALGVNDWNKIPGSYRLLNNYPNPFNPTSNVEFHLKAAGEVQLKVYNILGEEVATLVNTEMPAGVHQVTFNATNLPSGIYFYKLLVNDFTASKKMLLLK